MYLKSLELVGFKSFAKKSELSFSTPITSIVGPNGSGKSNVAEAFRFVLGEQSLKSMRTKRGEDLIWGGSQALPRANRASIKVVFENPLVGGQRRLNVDFDEVSVERAVFRDGTNEYLINGSKVRLKDTQELLAGANIGSSSHHIISQGEADRVLTASPRERREMIEDALGLRVYQYKKDESRKKLEKTYENREQVETLRRENAPHLRFLERQVKKLERARELRTQLIVAYKEYLKRERLYLDTQEAAIKEGLKAPETALHEVQEEIQQVRRKIEQVDTEARHATELLELERTLAQKREVLAQSTRSLGRVEGQLAFEERRIEEERRTQESDDERPVQLREIRHLFTTIQKKLHVANESEDPKKLQNVIRDIGSSLETFLAQFAKKDTVEVDTKELSRLTSSKADIEKTIEEAKGEVAELEARTETLRRASEAEKDASREHERTLFTLMGKETQLRGEIDAFVRARDGLVKDEEEFVREKAEGIVLVGDIVKEYDAHEPEGPSVGGESRDEQLSRRRELEKMKIRLEEMGGASAAEITKEYTSVKERDDFLVNELEDLDTATTQLENLLKDLDKELSDKFEDGFEKVASEFNEYFSLMFGGGSATMKLVKGKRKLKLSSLFGGGDEDGTETEGDESPETEEGVEIEVSLPKKKVQGLMMLSGGERALTSIALIFAMSQVNPPPFLILDETDAALDEANSRRYGDMIENLAKKSQLILISHNRETMSRAGVLYGVTMGVDGVSKLLSVKFEEAAAVAK